MKYSLRLIIVILILFGCNNEPKQAKTTSTVFDTIIPQKTLPPFQIVAEPQRLQARAIGDPVLETVITYTPRLLNGKTVYDTVVTTKTQTTKSVVTNYSYPEWSSVTKPFKETTTVPPVQPPTTGVKFLELPIIGPQDFSGKSGLVFENKRIVNAPGVAFKLYSGANNITIRNCFFDGAAGVLVELENASNITIENCLFADGYSGVYAAGSSNIKVINCQFVNMRIQRSSTGAFIRLGNMMQFNSCGDIQVLDNKGENFPEADPEDMISFYRSSNGLVKNNVFRGNPTATWSTSGGGIIAGDYGGNNVILEDNTLMTPGNYGMAIAGGTNMIIRNNKIFSARNAISNNPLYVWAQQGAVCGTITVTNNRVSWIDKNGVVNNGWNAGNCSNTIFQAPTSITFAEMGVPTHLIDKITPAELLIVRGK